MRDDLQLIEKIERYLAGELSLQEAAAFEQQMRNDASLREAVNAQRDVMQGLHRMSLRQDVRRVGKRYRTGRRIVRWTVLGAIGLIIAASVFLLVKKHHGPSETVEALGYNGTTLPMLNEHGQRDWATADSVIPAQLFDIAAGKDTVIETTGGMVLAIPANAFLTKNGKSASGTVRLCIKEALDPLTIMRARLSTMSGDRLLETGGMFFLDARQGDQILHINPSNGIHAELPADVSKEGMQLFSGKRMTDGTIDWINPVPLPSDLLSVDINGLDFYPPEYLHLLSRDGYPTTDKRFTDSLYFSLASLFQESEYDHSEGEASSYNRDTSIDGAQIMATKGNSLFQQNCASCHNPLKDATGPTLRGVSKRIPSREWLYKWIHNSSALIASGDKYANDLFNKWNKTQMTAFPNLSNEDIDTIMQYLQVYEGSLCGINPSKIKAIWNRKFQNTFLSTREFEQRLKLIHQSKDPALLDLYVGNLDKNLCQIDSMAARLSSGETSKRFLEFAATRNGRVKSGSKHLEKLREYYALKTRLFTEAATAAVRKATMEDAAADATARQKVATHQTENRTRMEKNFEQELELNLESAYRQLGMPRPSNAFATAGPSMSVIITNTGWNNVDRYVQESTATRSTLDYTDPQSGKKAVIEYKPISVTIDAAASYDRLLVYLLPDKLSSFMNLREMNGVFSEQLNSLMKYDLICIGIKKEQYFSLRIEDVHAGKYEGLVLKAIDSAKLTKTLNALRATGQAQAVRKEIAYASWDIQNVRRQAQRQHWQALLAHLKEALFSCEELGSGLDEEPVIELSNQ